MSRYPELNEQERFPLLTQAGRELLYCMRQHPHAPIWNWPNGEQLDAAGLEKVERFASDLTNHTWGPGDDNELPRWVQPFCDRCLETVPFYRRRGGVGHSFYSLPSFRRKDLSPRVWEFVPDTAELDELIVFSTSGTTGHPMRVPTAPWTAACGIPLIEQALSRFGQQFPRGPESVGLTNIVSYKDAFTTAIVIAYLQESGCVRVNLHPSAWRSADDLPTFINQWRSPIWLGDPQAFADLRRIELAEPPKVIVSSIFRLTNAMRQDLTSRYGCPVLDLYALTEAGIVALGTDEGHEILAHDLHVEILDDNDRPCKAGKRGEVTLTSARNPYLPLLRYRTGDTAALKVLPDGRRLLVDLEGREPVEFRLASGNIVHSMEVTRLMREYPLIRYRLYQSNDGGFAFAFQGNLDQQELHDRLRELLEHPRSLSFDEMVPFDNSMDEVVYRSDYTLGT